MHECCISRNKNDSSHYHSHYNDHYCLKISQVLSIIAVCFSYWCIYWWATFVLGVIPTIVLQIIWCCKYCNCYSNEALKKNTQQRQQKTNDGKLFKIATFAGILSFLTTIGYLMIIIWIFMKWKYDITDCRPISFTLTSAISTNSDIYYLYDSTENKSEQKQQQKNYFYNDYTASTSSGERTNDSNGSSNNNRYLRRLTENMTNLIDDDTANYFTSSSSTANTISSPDQSTGTDNYSNRDDGGSHCDEVSWFIIGLFNFILWSIITICILHFITKNKSGCHYRQINNNKNHSNNNDKNTETTTTEKSKTTNNEETKTTITTEIII